MSVNGLPKKNRKHIETFATLKNMLIFSQYNDIIMIKFQGGAIYANDPPKQ